MEGGSEGMSEIDRAGPVTYGMWYVSYAGHNIFGVLVRVCGL